MEAVEEDHSKTICRNSRSFEKKNELMDKLMNLAEKEKMKVFINKLTFYNEKERLRCTERQNKKLAFWLREKNYSSNKNDNQKNIPILCNNY